jgi:anaerobic magnesium-protoporphyrin IX monomethyl ester cyclase
MDIILIQCLPMNELYDTRYQSENLALGYLAASLRDDGYRTEILDAHLLELSHEKTVQHIISVNPWMVGLSSSAQDSIPATFHVVGLLRKKGYKGHITVGGHFHTYEHDNFLKHIPEIDSVVRGEGEITIVDLATHVNSKQPLSSVKGLTYRDENGKVVVNDNRSLVDDLDTLPLPHRDTMPILLQKNRRISMLASRGCYARCSFCSIQTFFNWRPRRVRMVEKVVEEMKFLYDQGVHKFKFVDDLFMDPSKKSKQWVLSFCQELKRAGMHDLNLWMQVRAVCVSEEIFVALKEIGLKKIFLGLESGHAETLKRYRKDITPEQNLKAVKILKEVGIPEISIGMMPFEPDVSIQGIQDNLDFLKKIGTFDIRDVTGKFLPYAGTPLTEQLISEGRIERKNWYEVGTYQFTDKNVDLLYKMILKYKEYAKLSLKMIYKLDRDIRDLEKHLSTFRSPEYQALYRRTRLEVESFMFEHGNMMLKIVEVTLKEVKQKLLSQEEQDVWYLHCKTKFMEAEKQALDIISNVQSFAAKYSIQLKSNLFDSIHVAAVKVIPQKQSTGGM